MKLFCRKYGNGPALIILHGLFGSSDNWVSMGRSLSDHFTVCLPDLRNHGRSPHSDIHNYNALSNDIYELSQDLGTERFFLAGHSMGGRAAMMFALKWPWKLLGLLVADISPVASPERDRLARQQHCEILNTILRCDLSKMKSRSEIAEFLKPSIGSGKVRELILKNVRRNNDGSFSWKLNARSLSENIDNIVAGIDASGYSETSGFPVIFLKGENSDYLPEQDFAKIKMIFPAAEFITIPHAGHWVNSDNPEAVRESFLRLLE